jgi:Leucine-rich repeat (LRR) protein
MAFLASILLLTLGVLVITGCGEIKSTGSDADGDADGDILFEDVAELRELVASDKEIAQLGGIECLTNLMELRLASNALEHIDDLNNLVQIEVLYLNVNQLTDIESVKNMSELATLAVSKNQIVDLSPLRGLKYVSILYLQENLITDITPLVDNPDIEEGDLVNILYNPIECEAQRENIDELEARGVDLRHEC